MLNPQTLNVFYTGITVEKLMKVASESCHLYDWGPEPFGGALTSLVKYVEQKYAKDFNMKLAFVQSAIDVLVKRLFVQDNFKSEPGILKIPIQKPLFVTGLPRTGTTMMHRVFAADSRWRVLLYWELLFPYLRQDIPNFDQCAVSMAEMSLKQYYQQRPDFIKRHEIKANSPEECYNLIRLSFNSISWANELLLPNYLEHYLDLDMTESYGYYKKLLQVQLWRRPGKYLLLKCPSHLHNIDAILNVFPDANIIWMHREPCTTIASGLSLLSVFFKLDQTAAPFIKLYMEYFKKSLQKAMTIEKIRPGQLKSVSYQRVMENPIEILQEHYNNWEYDWEPQIADNVNQWLERNPQHKYGVHKYNLEEFGLSREDIHKQFAFYYDQYHDLL